MEDKQDRETNTDEVQSTRAERKYPGGGDIFRVLQHDPGGSPSPLYNGHRVTLAGIRGQGRGVNHPPPSNTEDNERVELHFYSTLRPSLLVLGQNLLLHLRSSDGY